MRGLRRWREPKILGYVWDSSLSVREEIPNPNVGGLYAKEA